MAPSFRKLLVVAVALAGLALCAAPGLAQVNPGNPSGGTSSLRSVTEEGGVPVVRADASAPSWQFDIRLTAWLGNVTAGWFAPTVVSRPVAGRARAALASKRLWYR